MLYLYIYPMLPVDTMYSLVAQLLDIGVDDPVLRVDTYIPAVDDPMLVYQWIDSFIINDHAELCRNPLALSSIEL